MLNEEIWGFGENKQERGWVVEIPVRAYLCRPVMLYLEVSCIFGLAKLSFVVSPVWNSADSFSVASKLSLFANAVLYIYIYIYIYIS